MSVDKALDKAVDKSVDKSVDKAVDKAVDKPSKLDHSLRDLQSHMRMSVQNGVGAGLTFAVVILLGAALGYWLDSLLGWAPWLLITCALAGSVFGFIHLVERVSPGTLFKARRRSG